MSHLLWFEFLVRLGSREWINVMIKYIDLDIIRKFFPSTSWHVYLFEIGNSWLKLKEQSTTCARTIVHRGCVYCFETSGSFMHINGWQLFRQFTYNTNKSMRNIDCRLPTKAVTNEETRKHETFFTAHTTSIFKILFFG